MKAFCPFYALHEESGGSTEAEKVSLRAARSKTETLIIPTTLNDACQASVRQAARPTVQLN